MRDEEFDYVIVGGGSAGCVVAARLSEEPGVRVLLLEAGGRDVDPLISIPIGMGKIHQHRLHDWGYETEPDPNLDGRSLEATRGRVLGGSSSVNVMAYTRGHPSDYDRWAREGAHGWSFGDVLPYFRRAERFEGGADQWRGGDGPVGTQFGRSEDPIFSAWMEAGRQAGFATTPDYNGQEPEGFGYGQYTIENGRRASASRAYLRPARGRKNLVVRTRALALRVDFEGLRAVGVTYARAGETVRVRARREVVLSAGAFNTPQLLMLSGVGPADHLRAMGVTPRLDQPGVGAELQDHLGLWILWERKTPGAFHQQMRFDRMSLSMIRAYLFGTGPGTIVPGNLHAFVKTEPSLEAHDVEFMFHTVSPQARLWAPLLRPAYRDAYGIRPTLMRPHSRGEIRLRSDDPRAAPRIAYRFLTQPDDLPRLREGFRRAREVGMQAAMAPYRGAELTPGADCTSDAQIDAAIRRLSMTAHHPCATCRMGGEDAPLDPQLRVRGLDGLRVVDASAMPSLVSAHINACVLMMGEKAADLIRNAA